MHEISPSLEEMQQWFAHLITSPIMQSDADRIPLFPSDVVPEIRKKIAPSPTLRSEERMGIYQQQYWWRLISVMQELFPSLVALLDYEEFNSLIAEPYLASHIPQDWFISKIGDDLPKWLERLKPNALTVSNTMAIKTLPLRELALLDLAYEQLLFADILPNIDLAKCEKETLYLQPFVLLFELDVDLFCFRQEILREKKQPLQPLKKWRKKRYLVLYRLHEENFYEEIQPVFFELLSRLQKGAKLNEMIPLLERCEDVTSLFQKMGSRGWLTHCPSKASNRSMRILVQTQKRVKKRREN
jgi:hypothetical protein